MEEGGDRDMYVKHGRGDRSLRTRGSSPYVVVERAVIVLRNIDRRRGHASVRVLKRQ